MAIAIKIRDSMRDSNFFINGLTLISTQLKDINGSIYPPHVLLEYVYVSLSLLIKR
jgi:hypothetical protein